ncbi:hypothetical protein MRX96_054910 [Rhipicephalus microplus]
MSAVFWGDQSQQELEGLSRDCVIRTANGGEFRDVSASTMDALLGYCYSNKLCLNENNVTEILATADMLLMDEARNQCLHYLLRNLRIENCLGIASLVQWYHCPSFSKAVLSYVREHFDQVWRTSDEFPVVTESLLVELLSSNELNVHDEVDLLHAIVRWSSARNAFAGGAGATMSRLLQSFRVGLCDSLALEDFWRSHPTLARSRAFSQVVWEPQQQGPCLCSPSPLLLVQCAARRSSPGAADAVPTFDGYSDSNNTNAADAAAAKRRTSFPQLECERCGSARNPERWLPRMPYQMLFLVGGWSEGRERDMIETYDSRAGRWLMNHMQGFKPRAYHGVTLMQNRLYVVGGMRDTEYLRSCDYFDIKRCTWETCSSMNVARGYVSVVSLGGYVYAIGGRNAAERTASVERYDPCVNQWKPVCPMNKRRSDGAACVFRGKIYVSGGFDGEKVLRSVEMYSPSHERWYLVRSLPSPRCSHQMAVVGDRMYIIGGYDGRRRLSTVMCAGDEGSLFWRLVCPMRIGRSTFAAVLFDGELYVIGGFDGVGTTAEVERYCPSSDSWQPVVPLNEAVSAMAACTLKGLAISRRFSAGAER